MSATPARPVRRVDPRWMDPESIYCLHYARCEATIWASSTGVSILGYETFCGRRVPNTGATADMLQETDCKECDRGMRARLAKLVAPPRRHQ